MPATSSDPGMSWLGKRLSDLMCQNEVGAEVSKISTDTILRTGEETLTEFQERGGTVNTLAGDKLAAFQTLMIDKVQPAVADKIGAEVLDAAKAFGAN